MPNWSREFLLLTASGATSGPTALSVRKTKILVPLAGVEQVRMLADWLIGNPQLSGCDILLLHIVEPKLWQDPPFSAVRALGMLEAHEELLCAKRKMLSTHAEELQSRFPRIRISWQVRSDRLTGAAIVAAASSCDATNILVFTESPRALRLLGGSRLTREIINSADSVVQVVQGCKSRTAEFHPKMECLTGQV